MRPGRCKGRTSNACPLLHKPPIVALGKNGKVRARLPPAKRATALASGTVYEEGSVANVVAGMRVEMRGTLNADGRSIDVLRIHFER